MKRNNWIWPILAGVVSLLGFLSCSIQAQDYVYATGNPNFGVNYPIPDGYINVTNGNAHVTIPLGTFQQRGRLSPIKINLEYDSRIWQIIDNGGYSWQPVNIPNSMAGWRLTTGLEQGTTANSEYFQESPGNNCYVLVGKTNVYETNFTEMWDVYTAFQWTDSEGTVHIFNVQTEQPLQVCTGDTSHTVPTGNGYAIDSSGYYVEITNTSQMTVYDSQGNEVYPQQTDPNGNSVSISANGTVTDSMGRVLISTTTNGNTIQYNVLKEGGGTNTFTAATEPISLNTNFQQSAVSEFNGSLTAIQSLQLPDGSSYSFTYDSGTYGEMESMTLPTGGAVSLGYTNYEDSYNNYNRWISTEMESGGTASFSPKVLSTCNPGTVGCQEQMTLSRPSGDSRIYTLTLNDGAWDGQTDTYNGSTKLMTVVNNYNFQSFPCLNTWICTGAQFIAASSSSVTLDDTGQTAQTKYTYTPGTPWLIASAQEFDYGATSPNRETDYAYGGWVNGAWLLTQENQKFNGSAFAQTVYAYDGYGNLTSKQEGVSSPFSTTSYQYDNNGMRITKTDPCGNGACSDITGTSYTTTYIYSTACNDGYISQTIYPVTSGVSHITKVNPDCSSGLPLSTTDQNGQTTTYSYDSIGRKSSIGYPDGGLTSYQYPSPAEVVESKLLSGSTYSTLTTNWDGYGRKSQVTQSDPAGDDTVTSTYDGDNRLGCNSNPQRSGSSPTNGNTCYDYDALDRATLVTMPDGNKIHVAYSGNQATVTDESGYQKRYVYDAFHDLTQVFEPNASGTPNWETDYSYDAAGHLLGITQKGDGSSAARVSTFAYDSLGKMTGESTPEAGTKSYIYDPNGNLKSSTNALGMITYQYDVLNRLTSKAASNGSFSYGYTYDVATNGGFASSNPIGHLVEESNGVNASSQFSYDPMGRVSYQANCIPSNCTQTGNAVYAAYDLAGDLTSLTYPDGRTVYQSYDSAQHLTAVQYASWNGQSVNASYYSATGFAPPGETTAAVFGNGVQMAAAFNSRESIAALSYATSAQTLWSKQYAWAANAKNLLQVTDTINPTQTFNYTYDPDNRLTSASGGGQTLVSPATSGTASLTIAGSESSTYVSPPGGCHTKSCSTLVYNSGGITVTVGGIAETVSYSEGSNVGTIASALATQFNSDPNSLVVATASSATVSLTAKATGAMSNYPLDLSSATYESAYFSSSSFSATSTASTLTNGANAVTSGAGVLAETYAPDPWGNMAQSGTFTFGEGFGSNNQIASANGFSFDSVGDLLSDGLHTYTYNIDGSVASASGTQYVYDAERQRVQAGTSEFIYFQGKPVALYNTSTGGWTDLIWAGNNLLGEVAGNQTATPVYRLLDHDGSLIATTNGSGGVTGTTIYAPYGQLLSSNTSDPYMFTGLSQVPEGYHATYRDYAEAPGRWLSPDPYNGSYDLNNPQSFNRYSYVNGNPLAYIDPSGLSFVSDVCSALPAFALNSGSGFFTGANNAAKLGGYANQVAKGSCAGAIEAGAEFVAKHYLSNFLAGVSGNSGFTSAAAYFADIQAAITIGCSIDYNKSACGAPQLAWLIPGAGGDVGLAVGDSAAVLGAVCAAGGLASGGAVCIGVAIYELANSIYGFFYNLFGWGPPQFTGSLLPRPTDLGGLGDSPIGIPNQNLSTAAILGR